MTSSIWVGATAAGSISSCHVMWPSSPTTPAWKAAPLPGRATRPGPDVREPVEQLERFDPIGSTSILNFPCLDMQACAERRKALDDAAGKWKHGPVSGH